MAGIAVITGHSNTGHQSMLLDPAIRDWVLIPIMLVMVGVGILRHYLTLCLQSSTTSTPTLAGVREASALARCRLLRAASIAPSTPGGTSGRCPLLPPRAFLVRKQHLSQGMGNGVYLKVPVIEGQSPPNPLADPQGLDAMMGMMKGNVMMIVPQSIIMAWITAFFSGFVIIRLPFPLTIRFKQMLQRGIETGDMDVSWVSSISWYFLNLFGLKCIFTLILGNGNAASASMQGQLAMVPGMNQQPAMQQPAETAKVFKNEKELLDLIVYGGSDVKAAALEEEESAFMEGAEERLLARYRWPTHASSTD